MFLLLPYECQINAGYPFADCFCFTVIHLFAALSSTFVTTGGHTGARGDCKQVCNIEAETVCKRIRQVKGCEKRPCDWPQSPGTVSMDSILPLTSLISSVQCLLCLHWLTVVGNRTFADVKFCAWLDALQVSCVHSAVSSLDEDGTDYKLLDKILTASGMPPLTTIQALCSSTAANGSLHASPNTTPQPTPPGTPSSIRKLAKLAQQSE